MPSCPRITYWRDCLFSIEYSCLLYQRLINHKCLGYFWALYHVPLFCLFGCHYHTVFITISLKDTLKSGSMISPALFVLFKIVLSIGGFLCFWHKNFKIIVLVLWKFPWYFDRNCIKSVCCFYKDGHSINSFLYTLKYKNLKLLTIPILLLFRLYSLGCPIHILCYCYIYIYELYFQRCKSLSCLIS